LEKLSSNSNFTTLFSTSTFIPFKDIVSFTRSATGNFESHLYSCESGLILSNFFPNSSSIPNVCASNCFSIDDFTCSFVSCFFSFVSSFFFWASACFFSALSFFSL
jgi:hypothetical protein